MQHIRSQKYAQRAYGLIQKVKDDNKQVKEYRTLVLNFPTMILQSGLAQAIGFYKPKAKKNTCSYWRTLPNCWAKTKTVCTRKS